MAKENSISLLSLVAASIILITVAVSVITGIAILTQMSETVRADTTVNQNSSTDIIGINNQSSVAVGTTGQFPFLRDLKGCFQSTNSTLTLTKNTDYTFSKGNGNGGTVLLTTLGAATHNGTNLNCSTISYKGSSAAQLSADVFILGIAIFGSFMGVLVIGIVGRELLNMFKK